MRETGKSTLLRFSANFRAEAQQRTWYSKSTLLRFSANFRAEAQQRT
ncbi:MAG: hypothetical protein U7127_01695 [Phormidium sp.]